MIRRGGAFENWVGHEGGAPQLWDKCPQRDPFPCSCYENSKKVSPRPESGLSESSRPDDVLIQDFPDRALEMSVSAL